MGGSFETELKAVLAEARAQVAAGREPAAEELAARLRAAGAPAKTQERALAQLDRIVAVHRARTLVAEKPREAPAPRRLPGRPKPALRTRPTVSANMQLRREGDGADAVLVWDAAHGVAGWEVRISERPDARGDYEVRETLELEPAQTRAPLRLGERAVRVHVLGRGRDGRLLRRAIVAGLTAETWRDRWQQRPSAS